MEEEQSEAMEVLKMGRKGVRGDDGGKWMQWTLEGKNRRIEADN